MKIGLKKSDKTTEDPSAAHDLPEETISSFLNLKPDNTPEGYFKVETYPLKPPFSYASVAQNEDTAEFLYIVDELPLTKEEIEVYRQLREILEFELQAPDDEENLRQAFQEQVKVIIEKNAKVQKGISPIGSRKLMYYLERDLVGFGRIDALMFDQNVEDIGCSGANKPIFLWHRKYENIKTNVFFKEDRELEDFVMKIVHRSGKHVSIAFPIVDVTLPGKHRLAVSYGKEVTPSGTNFTIRKFREDPFTIIDLIQNETIDETIAAYLWLLMENKMSVMILGATGAGKTTALNAIACLIRPNYKIISVEEVSEINLPHENWVSNIARSGFGSDSEGEIPLFGLIKSAVRHRPDLIIVGEVRGEEAYVLFQALATGHGGICTMHAEDVETAMTRLTQPPMNIPASILPLMNCTIVVKHVRPPIFAHSGKRLSSRKFIKISELTSANTVSNVFEWNASSDTFKEDIVNSYVLKKIAKNVDLPLEEVLQELEYRRRILARMAEQNIRDYHSVNRTLSKYYQNPPTLRADFSERLGW